LLAFEFGLVIGVLGWFHRVPGQVGLPGWGLASAMAAGGAWLHWLRFQVPITLAAGLAAAIGCLIALLLSLAPQAKDWIPAISLVAGMLAFFIAMRWDAADTLRLTRKSDVAFWLHLLAAPLLVHSTFAFMQALGDQAGNVKAILILSIYLLIALISLVIDRRALMVSSLAYVLYAFSSLLTQFGIVSLSFAVTALVIGSALLLLSAFWQSARIRVLARLPVALKQRVPAGQCV
jgi:hypothetical protein